MAQAEIGVIGLAVMGANLALNIAEKGFPVAVYNRTAETTARFHANAGELAGRVTPCATLAEFVAAIRPPRPVIIMVKAGDPVDQQIALLRPLLSAGDIIIDAGNANFRDTIRRFAELDGSGLTFIGMGVSGGEEGARHGPSIMVGNEGRLNSYLIEITAAVLAAGDARTGRPMVDVILDRAGQKGTGRWAVIEAQMMGVPATAIEAAVAARSLSAMKDEREGAEALYGANSLRLDAGDRTKFVGELELALLAGKVAAYAQGFAVMATASKEFSWNLPMATIARIWRAGCIIRSQFLDTIASAFQSPAQPANLLVAPQFVTLMKEAHGPLRHVVSRSTLAGAPVPALAAALAYFDSYRQGRGTANLIQAQRDFFGAHGFEREGEPGTFHGPWGNPPSA
ncbi:MAG: NADP-dependent phosphogluconate dehydrogenase [Rhizobiales bacterium]|nr:NADP-dependent phosphogluconate dehydrogenase [Hyphomicrobiales bacterium]